MPCLDTAILRSYFQKYTTTSKAQPLLCSKTSDLYSFGWKKRWIPSLKLSIQIPIEKKLNSWQYNMQGRLLVKPVATFETNVLAQTIDVPTKDGHLLGSTYRLRRFELSAEDANDIVPLEKLRRVRISKANRGNIPWNKGRKHSPETICRIQEKTKLAMQDPKVKMKLKNVGHAHSEETRVKIGLGVRKGWQLRRQKMTVQVICCLQWQNLIAEASRKGFLGGGQLQWDSFKNMDEMLEEEWLKSVNMRKAMLKPKGSRRALKSPEQRRKISEAISAKWADPEYRNRVCSALAVYHGNSAGTEKKSRKKSSEESRIQNSSNEKPSEKLGSSSASAVKTKPSKNVAATSSCKDPLTSAKLEMIKRIKIQRTAMETKKGEVTLRARLLIAEAEKAAKALELAAPTSPLARASLIEARKFIAQAIQSLEGIDSKPLISESSSGASSESNQVTQPTSTRIVPGGIIVNGTNHPSLRGLDHGMFRPGDFELAGLEGYGGPTDIVIDAGKNQIDQINNEKTMGKTSESLSLGKLRVSILESDRSGEGDNLNSSFIDIRGEDVQKKPKIQNLSNKRRKKWVCGRLVEVEEG